MAAYTISASGTLCRKKACVSDTCDTMTALSLKQLCALQSQAKSTESLIKEEFKKLHGFLQMEEAMLIDELKQEQEQKNETIKNKIEEITKAITSISQTISVIEQEMHANDLSFLQVSFYTEPLDSTDITMHQCFFHLYTTNTLYIVFF